jgi:sugar phosphate isomerase/epimerase
MKSRRDFITLSFGALASATLLAKEPPVPIRQPIGLQLYTLRQQAEADMPKTLAAVRAAGYDEVELYWNVYSHPAKELKQMLRDAGLSAPSGHFDYLGLEGKLDYARELGLKYVVCPILPEEMRTSEKSFQAAAAKFNPWGEKIQKLGMTFAFHNHNYEFRQFDGQTGFDILMKYTDPKLVKLEMDCYWITQAGRDPLAMMSQYQDRIRMLHLKDRKPGFATSQELNKAAEHFTEFGTGSIQWRPIIAKAKTIGVQYYFIEQDEMERPPIESITTSLQNARKIL